MAHPRLNRDLLGPKGRSPTPVVSLPPTGSFELPEKVLQFGSGRLLRGFVDTFVDEANREGVFEGRVVVVQSTGTERARSFNEQDGLFTTCIEGLEDGEEVRRYAIRSSVSRAIPAREEWGAVLDLARSADLEIVTSNTTEVGIQLDREDRIDRNPPRSFPGKLTAVLYARYEAFSRSDRSGSAAEHGLTIVPTELIEANGETLRGIVLDLTREWELGSDFREWIREANRFCNTLVDRIVTGRPDEDHMPEHVDRIGYEDELLTVGEPYRLWAIEGGEEVAETLSFAQADEGIVLTDDIEPYRTRKVRILNGAHTTSVPVAYLAGGRTVLEMMEDELTGPFVEELVREEILPTVEDEVERPREFAEDVLERFRNPFLEHQLLDITLQESTKLRHRVLPSVLAHREACGTMPARLSFGFAAALLFLRGREKRDGRVYGRRGGEAYPIRDDRADWFLDAWREVDPSDAVSIRGLVEKVASETRFWGRDLTNVDGFVDAIAGHLQAQLENGIRPALRDLST